MGKAQCLAAFLTCMSPAALADPLPNIAIIYPDDLGLGISAYTSTNSISTPNLKDLAEAGARLNDAHSASSVCTPSRYALLTGRDPWRTSLFGVRQSWEPPLIDGELTIASMLKSKGYATGMFGKNHLGLGWTTTDSLPPVGKSETNNPNSGSNVDFSQPVTGGPTDYGFDYFWGMEGPYLPPHAWIENDQVLGDMRQKPVNMFGLPGPMALGWSHEAVAPTVAEKAVDWIEEQTEPFFVYVAMTTPHIPIAPTRRDLSNAQGEFGKFVREMDEQVGQIIDALPENTLVIFTADNAADGIDGQNYQGALGSLAANHGYLANLGFRGSKGKVWEGGHRVPTIVWWEGQTTPDSLITGYFTQTDICRTLARVVDYTLGSEDCVDSFDQTPMLFGWSVVDEERTHGINISFNGTFTMRRKATDGVWRWKYIAGAGSGDWSDPSKDDGHQLYNLETDISETTNVTTPSLVNAFAAILAQIRSGSGLYGNQPN